MGGTAGAVAATNEVINNCLNHPETCVQDDLKKEVEKELAREKAALGEGKGIVGYDANGEPFTVLDPTAPFVGQFGSRGSAVGNEATSPVGISGSPMTVPRGTNAPTTINGIDYSGHAIDQMQGRGIPPSVVQNTIQNGAIYPTNEGTMGYYDSVNNVRVITNSTTGRVVTVIPGAPGK